MTGSLTDRREAVAQEEFEGYDFQGSEAVASDGWEFSTPGDEWTRFVYFANEEDPEGDTVRGHFVVRFDKNTDRVAEAYAALKGNIFGARGTEVPAQEPGR